MTNDKNKDLRHYLGALGIFLLIICLLLFLSFVIREYKVSILCILMFVAGIKTLLSWKKSVIFGF